MTVEVVSKNMGVRENGAKGCVIQEYFLVHIQGLTCEECVYDLETLSLDLLLKFGPIKKIPSVGFLTRMLKSV
jgi:hypothetical protein